MKNQSFETDTFPTEQGPLEIHFIGHGSLMMTWNGRVLHVDPFSRVADYSLLPPADLVLVTHEHRDHLDPEALKHICAAKTTVILTELGARQFDGGRALKNGDRVEVEGIGIEAVPAYNLVHKRENGEPFHPRGHGNGYVLGLGGVRVYIAGDTEDIPEMQALKGIDVAFLPVNLPYTMTPEMAARAAGAFQPKILYPYHYGSTRIQELADLLAGSGTEVRIRKLG